MRGGLAYALAQLSERERLLLALMVLVAVPVGIVFLVILPLMEAREAAHRRAADNAALLTWVAAQVTQMPVDAEASVGGEARTPTIGIAGIEESLVSADLREQVVQLANRSDGGVNLSMEDAPFDTLSQWLRQMKGSWGYNLTAFRFEAASPGLVNAVFELAPP